MTPVARFTEELLPDGSMLLAQGANRVCRQLGVLRTRGEDPEYGEPIPVEYELRMRFTIPEETVLDLSSIELHEI